MSARSDDFLRNMAPKTRAVAIVPHDGNALAEIPEAIYIGTGGQITMRGPDGTMDAVWKNVPSGSTLPFQAQYIRATGTTAQDMLALYSVKAPA